MSNTVTPLTVSRVQEANALRNARRGAGAVLAYRTTTGDAPRPARQARPAGGIDPYDFEICAGQDGVIAVGSCASIGCRVCVGYMSDDWLSANGYPLP